MTITIKEVSQRLAYYNEWRRGGDGEQPNPTQLGHDLDYAVMALNVLQKIESGEDWHTIESAPKDGKEYLFSYKGKPNAINKRSRYDGIIVDRWKETADYKGWWNELPEAKHTHWKPLDGKEHIAMLLEKEIKNER